MKNFIKLIGIVLFITAIVFSFTGCPPEPSTGGGGGGGGGGTTGSGNDGSSMEKAILLTSNVWAKGNIPASSFNQWFVFTATTATQYIHFNNSGALIDVNVQIVDNSGEIVGASQSNLYGTALNSRTSRTLVPGQKYYIKVWPYGSGSGTYHLLFNTSTTAPVFTWSAPVNAASLTAGIWKDGSIPAASIYSGDWYVFQVTAGSTYRIWWNDSGQGNGMKTQDIVVTAFNANGTKRFTNADSAWNSSATFTPTANGTIYLHVNATATPGGTYGIVYTVNNSVKPVTPFVPPSATMLTAGTWVNGAITTSGGEAWYSFEAAASTTYRIWCNGSTGDGTKSLNARVSAWYANGNNIITNENIPWNSPTTFTPASGGTIYLRVIASAGTGTFGIVFTAADSEKPAAPIAPPDSTVSLTAGIWADGEITSASGGEAWYSFNVTAGTAYSLWFNNLSFGNGIKTLNANIHGWYANGTEIFVITNTSWATARSIASTMEDTIVYIRVTPVTSAQTGTFGIVYGEQGTTRPDVPVSPANHTPLSSGIWVDETITASAGEIWYSFNADTAGTTYRVWLNGNNASASNNGNGNGIKTLNANIRGWYANGADAFASTNASWGTARSITPTADQVGLVYIRVTPVTSGQTGTFGIVYTAADSVRPAASFSPPNPTPIYFNQWADGEITAASGNAIWYSFSVESGTTYRIWWNDSYQGSGKTLDVSSTAYYSDGTIIFNNVDSGWTTPQNFTSNQNGTVYIRITPYILGQTGTFGVVWSTDTVRPSL
ncbi:MAG: PPC domain-containing protein [Treponema sp.]|nr:PPC domain-containing protein [Treponema sp.]